jgi:hypothetical protein
LSHLGTNSYFCLAQQYIKDHSYEEFFLSLPKEAWICLDNGIGDFEPVTEQQLLDVACELKPNEVVSPDVLFDSTKTNLNLIHFLEEKKKYKELDNTEVLFVPQGNTISTYMESYKLGLNHPLVNTIGLSKITVPYVWYKIKGDVGIMEARHSCFNYLKVHNLLQKPIHLLGAGSPLEFQYYNQHDTNKVIRSNDSCNSIWSAINEIEWKEGNFTRIATPSNYFDLELSDKQLQIAIDNIQYIQNVAHKL